MIARLSSVEMKALLGLKTDRALVSARAVRTPDGRWWQACRGLGLKDHEAPNGWIEPYSDAARDDAADLEREAWRAVGRGRAVDYED